MFNEAAHLLYCLVIDPIEYLIEVIYVLMYRLLDEPGYALFGVSLAVSFLVLPLYLRADAIQEEETKRQKEMSGWLDHIRKTFRGDEKQYMIFTYYSEQGYRPIYALRGVFPLLLQIPFFIAAYHYLSHLTLLSGVQFLGIADLGSEDGILCFHDFRINLLPVMMTLINLVSGYIYTKGLGLKEKLQVYLPALIFLFLLYHSPSGLVIYWTMNNVFSLIKNFISKRVKNKYRLTTIILCLIGMVLLIYVLRSGKVFRALNGRDPEGLLYYLLLPVLLSIPLIRDLMKKDHINHDDTKYDSSGFFTTGIFLVIFYGVMIPLSVISSSPQEFFNKYYFRSPLLYIASTFAAFSGLFLLWGSVVFNEVIRTKRGKEIYTSILFGVGIFSMINYFFFEAEVGNYGARLNFEFEPHFDKLYRYGNAILVLLIIVIGFILWRKWKTVGKRLFHIIIPVMVVMSVGMIVKIQREVNTAMSVTYDTKTDPQFHLSRTGKNVVVIMLDRSMGVYVPFIMQEKPELIEKFDGFTLYPNSTSTGLRTNFGSPGLYGGYDYSSTELMRKADMLMREKHDQALRIMPQAFSDAGYTTSIADIPYAGYHQISDYSIFDDIENVNAFDYKDRIVDVDREKQYRQLMMERNFCFYSLYRSAPAILQDNVYDHSYYLSETYNQNYSLEFTSQYDALSVLDQNTVIDDGGDCLMIYCSCLTHEPTLLDPDTYQMTGEMSRDYPDDYVKREIDGIEMDLTDQFAMEHYHVNMAAFLLLGEWFDHLREQGVYDNTRIILVSDHGVHDAFYQFPSMMISVDGEIIDTQMSHALLMEKDFGATGFTTDRSFMCNADVPALAMEGIVEDPHNPYTGNPIDYSGKQNGIDIVWSENSHISEDQYVPICSEDTPWYHIQDDIYLPENWSRIY